MKKKIIAVGICLVVLVACIGVLQWRSVDADDRMIAAIETTAGDADAMPIAEVEETSSTTEYPPREENGSFVIGNPDAPVTIMEFSSLSCPHCASFHKGALPDLKKDYVDTGKVKFVFRDFPLNASAVAGSLLLKCVPLDNRYDFMEMLFDQQSQWAFEPDFINKLKQYAALLGIGNDEADKCISDRDTEAAMFDVMREGNAEFEISSTPTFIIQPGNEKLVGAQPYGEFSKRIEALLKAAE